MELTVKQRLWLRELLPAKGTFEEIEAKQPLKEKLSFTQEEEEALSLKKVDGGFTFNTEKVFSTDIEFSEVENGMLLKGLQMLSDAGQLDDDLFPIMKTLKGL